MKVRIFEDTRSALEDNINQWLIDHPDVKIIKILQSNQKDSMATISIWYE
jgi:hypothetical protein